MRIPRIVDETSIFNKAYIISHTIFQVSKFWGSVGFRLFLNAQNKVWKDGYLESKNQLLRNVKTEKYQSFGDQYHQRVHNTYEHSY